MPRAYLLRSWSRCAAASAALALALGAGGPVARAAGVLEGRAAFVAGVARVLGVEGLTGAPQAFSDLARTNADFAAVMAAYRLHWVAGYPDGSFRPDAPLTREEAAKIEVAALGLEEAAHALGDVAPPYADGRRTATWAWGDVSEASAVGLLHGFPGGDFRPAAPMTGTAAGDALRELAAYVAARRPTPATGGSDACAAGPDALMVTAEPRGGTAGAPLEPAVAVAVEDGCGAPVVGDLSEVTATLQAVQGPTTATLAGSPDATLAGGAAAFSDLRVDGAGTFTLVFTDRADGLSAESTPFAVASGPPAALTLGAPASVAAGAGLTVAGAVYDAYGDPLAGVPVRIGAGGASTEATTDPGGAYAGTLAAPTVAGDAEVTASLANAPDISATAQLAVTAADPADITLSLGTSLVEANGALQATGVVSDAYGNPVPGAEVDLALGADALEVPADAEGAYAATLAAPGAPGADDVAAWVRGLAAVRASQPLVVAAAGLAFTAEPTVAASQDTPGDTAVTVAPNVAGDRILAAVDAASPLAPALGAPPPAGAAAYSSDEDLPAASGDYVGLYEVDAAGGVVAFADVGPLLAQDVLGAPYAQNCSLTGPASALAGQPATYTLTLADEDQNPVSLPVADITPGGYGGAVFGAPVLTAPGTYAFTATDDTAQYFTAHADVLGLAAPVTASLAEDVQPGPPAPGASSVSGGGTVSSGSRDVALDVVVTDAYGNALAALGPSSFSVASSDPAAGSGGLLGAPSVIWQGGADYQLTLTDLDTFGFRPQTLTVYVEGVAIDETASVTVTGPPQVTGVTPATGAASGGTEVTVSGSGFTGATEVLFGATPATDVAVLSDGELTATAPPGGGSVDVTVTNAYGTSAAVAADRFTYQ